MFTVPWTLYQSYGDKRALAENYPAMQRYAAFLRTIEDRNGIVGGGLGDWMSTAGTMPRNTETAFYAHDLKLMAEIAEILGKAGDARRYAAGAVRVAAAYDRAFYDRAAGRYRPASQGAQALPLALGLVAPADETAVRQALIDTIRHPTLKPDRDGLFGPILPDHIAAGDVATTYVWRSLGDMRRSDLVDRMILQPTMPSYWNMVANGLTAIPEAWNYPISRSWNHDMYAGIVEWFYRSVGGLAPAAPGYARITVAPVPPPGMAQAETRYDSVRGPIVSNWRREGERFTLDVEVPPNSRAEVLLPVPAAARITESGRPLVGAHVVAGGTMIEIGSGRYSFVAVDDRRTR
ncbi:alpha-L-rhamnosidase-related protein [Sphingomonas sp. Tas61C01]|uniref:alpha-L-rhamnosidase-related protein n=1 Tax=Sphingomonas sp. Tas61C01 TaxID=3458297 RepID=UPI00403E74B3